MANLLSCRQPTDFLHHAIWYSINGVCYFTRIENGFLFGCEGIVLKATLNFWIRKAHTRTRGVGTTNIDTNLIQVIRSITVNLYTYQKGGKSFLVSQLCPIALSILLPRPQCRMHIHEASVFTQRVVALLPAIASSRS